MKRDLARAVYLSVLILTLDCLYFTSYTFRLNFWARILVQVTIYRRLLIGRDGHLDQSEAQLNYTYDSTTNYRH